MNDDPEEFVEQIISMAEKMTPRMTDLAARILWQFYNKLQSEGFSPEQAFDLTRAYSKRLSGVSANAK